MRLDADGCGDQTGSQEPVWEAVWTAPGRGFPGSWENPRNPEIRVFSQVPGNRRFGRVPGREGWAGRLIPYSIYISQFQTGTPKPRYIGFRAGGRENGTRNGQFRPVFGHILRPLPKPHFFTKFVLWSVSRHGFVKSRKSELRRGVGRGSGGGSGGVSGAASQELLQTAPDCPPDCPQTEASVWSLPPSQTHLAQVRVAKLASLRKSPQPGSQVGVGCADLPRSQAGC